MCAACHGARPRTLTSTTQPAVHHEPRTASMSKYKVAHIREQGIDLIIVPLEPAFDRQPETAQHATIGGLQACANAAGLRGTVVPVWLVAGRMRFIARPEWHPFFRGLQWETVIGNLNKELTCR